MWLAALALWQLHSARRRDAIRYLEVRDSAQARDDHLAAAAHDLKAPLVTISASAQLLRRRVSRGAMPTPAELTDRLRQIERVSSRMSAQIDELLDVVRVHAGQTISLEKRSVDLVRLVEGAVSDARQISEVHQIGLETDCRSLVGLWDSGRLERMIGNILANAIKYSPRGGSVTVRLQVVGRDAVPAAELASKRGASDAPGKRPGLVAGPGERHPASRSAAPRATRWVSLSVTDQGVGISADEQPRVFDRFFRGSNAAAISPGAGIGLTGARYIVEEHGGRISVISRLGMGSTFTVWLPLDALDASAEAGTLGTSGTLRAGTVRATG